MKIEIDTNLRKISVIRDGIEEKHNLYDKKAFELLSTLWLKLSWQQKYSYTFTWMGRPIIQHPEDVLRVQEAIYELRPDVIVETGVAHGGSLVLSASILQVLGNGRVIGVDIEIRPSNRKEIENHPLSPRITLIEGDSRSHKTVERVREHIGPQDRVLVILDSDHSKAHVRAELEAYHSLVSIGSYIVATDGIMQDVWDTPRGKPEWQHDNPVSAVRDFLRSHNNFVLSPPRWRFNESDLDSPISAYPEAWLKRTG